MIFFLPVPAYSQPAQPPEDTVEIGRRALQFLAGLASSPDPEIRAEACAAWGQIGNRAAIPMLRRALKDPDPHVRIEAAYALHRLGSKDGHAILEAMAQGGGDEKGGSKDKAGAAARAVARDTVRARAISKLSEIGGVRAVSILEKTFNEPSAIVRDASAIALSRMGFDELDAVFIEMLGDPDESVRAASARALAEIGRPSGVDDLISAAADESPAVRAEALRALAPAMEGRVLEVIVQALKDPDRLVRAAAARALAKQGPSATKTLYEVAADTASPVLALKAMYSLSFRGDRVNYDFLSRVLGYDDPDLLQDVVEVLDAGKGDKPVVLLKQIYKTEGLPERVRLRVAAALLKRVQRVKK